MRIFVLSGEQPRGTGVISAHVSRDAAREAAAARKLSQGDWRIDEVELEVPGTGGARPLELRVADLEAAVHGIVGRHDDEDRRDEERAERY
jgi:hypothetical protein